MNRFTQTILWAILPILLFSQGSNLPIGNQAYHILDRLEIKTGLPLPYHSTLKYYTRGSAAQCALTFDTAQTSLSFRDRLDLYYIFRDNNEWLATSAYPTTLGGKKQPVKGENELTQVEASQENPRYTLSRKPFLKHFYKTPANFFEVNKKYFHLRLNPILAFKLGKAQDDDQLIFTNRRGLELRGGVDDRIYFYFSLLETQSRFPDYVTERIIDDRAIPGQGFFKNFNSELFNIENGYDYLNGQGYIGFNATRHVGFQFGYGRNFIGNGYRSLLLSDFSNNYLYLKVNWNIWRFHYQNLFTELSLNGHLDTPSGALIPKKYMAAHHLSISITPQITLGVFETVIFSRADQFELQYLNPIILYRTIEQSVGSPDNVLIGFDGKWNFLNRFQLYGQVMLDEFAFRELVTNNRGWWANKYGIQIGGKYIDAFGVDHLDLQAEFNTARPYTYSHTDRTANYTHYNQPLAHPLGANFKEYILKARFQPTKKWILDGRIIRASFGEDVDTTNYGGNIRLPNTTREMDFDNAIGQGIGATTTILGLDISYQLAHNVFVDLHYFYRKKDSEDDLRDKTTQFISGGFRVNIAKQRMDF